MTVQIEGAVVQGAPGVSLIFDSHDGVEIELMLSLEQITQMVAKAQEMVVLFKDQDLL